MLNRRYLFSLHTYTKIRADWWEKALIDCVFFQGYGGGYILSKHFTWVNITIIGNTVQEGVTIQGVLPWTVVVWWRHWQSTYDAAAVVVIVVVVCWCSSASSWVSVGYDLQLLLTSSFYLTRHMAYHQLGTTWLPTGQSQSTRIT